MTDPITYTSATPRLALPLLYPGQSQKEMFVNAAFSLADFLLHPAISGERIDPPASPIEGETWLVGDDANGQWQGHDGSLASFQSGSWLFASPGNGMRVLDLSNGQFIAWRDGWKRPASPSVPSGGTTVDNEARTAIEGLIASLKEAGIFPAA